MKAKFLAPVALVLAVAGCGGKASFTVGGAITGLTYSGLVLTNNGGDRITVPAGATSYSFPNSIDYGDEYTIAIEKQPAHQTCGAAAGSSTLKGAAGYTETISVPLVCIINRYKLSGTVSGLTADLVIANGNGTEYTVAKGSTTFTYPDEIASQTTYGLAVITQPAGLTCTITNGTAMMGDADVTNVAITCKPNA